MVLINFSYLEMNILVVEDELELAAHLESVLKSKGHKVSLYTSVEEVIGGGHAQDNDLIILDLMLDGKSGDHLVKHLREKKLKIPILVLSALGQISKKIDLINMGADDYLTKPFDPEELIARINALYRRSAAVLELNDEERFGDLAYFNKQKKVEREGKEILLTKQENLLFQFLLRNRSKVVPIDEIMKKVWKTQVGYHSNVIPATIRRLRQKIDTGFRHQLIRNIHGVGYTLVLEDDE